MFYRISPFFKSFKRSLTLYPRFFLPILFFGKAQSLFYLTPAEDPHLIPIKDSAINHQRSNVEVLSKNDYFMKIVGNDRDYFFFIIYNEEIPDTFQEAMQIASTLQRSTEKYDIKPIPIVYLMEKSVFIDIKNTINRVKNIEIHEKTIIFNNIEIYFKSPISSNQVYFKYKENFHSKRHQKKLFKLLRKLIEPVKIIEDSEGLYNALYHQTLKKINNPLVLKVLDDKTDKNMKNAKILKKYKKNAFYFYERRLLGLETNFIIINKGSIGIGLDPNETYLMRNDILTKIDEKAVITDKIFKIEDNTRQKVYNLEKYTKFQKELLISDKTFSEIKDEKKKENACLTYFLLPKVFILGDMKKKSLGAFFKKINFNKKKPILSFLINEDEIENNRRLLDFVKIMESYENKLHFVVITSEQLEEFFPHVNKIYGRFCLFNFFNQNKNSNFYKNYYKHLIYPYEKHFLNDEENYFESFDTIKGKIEEVLHHRKSSDFISNTSELIEDINSDIFDKKIRNDQTFIAELYDNSIRSQFSRGVFNKIAENDVENNFVRMHYLNDSQYCVNIAQLPAFLIWDHKKKTMYVYQPNFKEIDNRKGRLEEELKKFILKIKE